MMRFKDFPIETKGKDGLFSKASSEKADETLLRINNWVETNELGVLNIETLLFPGLNRTTEGTGSAVFKSPELKYSHSYYQVFRVWYKESKPMA